MVVDPPSASGAGARFNLLDEPWIPVTGLDGRSAYVGLTELFRRAGELRWLVGDAPIVTAAVHRLLQAIAHRAAGPASRGDWQVLWSDAERLPEMVTDYLDSYRDRFWLAHPTRPFLQCPGLSEKSPGTVSSLVLGRASGNNATLFDHTTAAERVRLPAAEAARWLVTLHAYDPGGTKTPYRKDKYSKAAPCGLFGVTLVEGRSLRETLLLNLPVYAPGRGLPSSTRAEDRPPWEGDEPPTPEPIGDPGRIPRGWVDLLTWPSRRILLHTAAQGDGLHVDGVVVTPGERLQADPKDVEQQAAFRRALKWGKKGVRYPTGDARPVLLENRSGIWRHAAELLLAPRPDLGRQRPAVLDHVAGNAPEEIYTLRVIGQRMDGKRTVVESWAQEELPAPVALLRLDDDHPLEALLGHSVHLADQVGSALGRCENGYARALGWKPSKVRGRPQTRGMLVQWYWPSLDAPFARMLHRLGVIVAEDGPVGRTVEHRIYEEFGGWGETCVRAAKEAVHAWGERLPRASERQVMELGQQQRRFLAQLREHHRNYEIEIAAYRSGHEEDSGE